MSLKIISRVLTVFGNLSHNSKLSVDSNLIQKCKFHITTPDSGINKLIKRGIDITKYTLRPIRYPKTGGRGEDGRVRVRGIGGGKKRHLRMVDFTRNAPKDGPPLFEKVMSINYDPNRSARIAVVATGERKRYIIASENMKPGDIIKTSNTIPRMSVIPEEGNSYPLGALPLGTIVHNIEEYVGQGGKLARAAGTSGVLVRAVGDRCIVKLPSNQEINIPKECMCTVGRVSNINHNQRNLGRAGTSRWLGIRPQSGFWKEKTGRFGRKIRRPRSTFKNENPKPPPAPRVRFSF